MESASASPSRPAQFLLQHGKQLEDVARMALNFVPPSLVTSETGDLDERYQFAHSAVDAIGVARGFARPARSRTPHLLLALLRCFQVSLEMWVRRAAGGRRGRVARLLLLLELGKAVLRLLARRGVRSRLCLEAAGQPEDYQGRRTGRRLRPLRALDAPPPEVLAPLPWAEAVSLARPVLHAAVFDRRDAASWLLPVLLDAGSLAALAQLPGLSAAESAELRSRATCLPLALVRSPVFDRVLAGPAQRFAALWNRVPILNALNIVDYALALQPLYFSTSGT